MKFLLILIILLTTSGCDQKTPIKYMVCDTSYKNCILIGKFKDIETCEWVKERQSWHCDSVSLKGKATCITDQKSSTSISYCSE